MGFSLLYYGHGLVANVFVGQLMDTIPEAKVMTATFAFLRGDVCDSQPSCSFQCSGSYR